MEVEIDVSYPSTEEEENKVGNINEPHSPVHLSFNQCGENPTHERVTPGHVLSCDDNEEVNQRNGDEEKFETQPQGTDK